MLALFTRPACGFRTDNVAPHPQSPLTAHTCLPAVHHSRPPGLSLNNISNFMKLLQSTQCVPDHCLKSMGLPRKQGSTGPKSLQRNHTDCLDSDLGPSRRRNSNEQLLDHFQCRVWDRRLSTPGTRDYKCLLSEQLQRGTFGWSHSRHTQAKREKCNHETDSPRSRDRIL